MSILVIAETREGDVRHATYSALGAAKQLTELLNVDYDILVLGKGGQNEADKLKDFGAKNIYWSAAATVADYTAEAYAEVAKGLIEKNGYTTAMAAATTTGKDLMPRLAGLVDAGMASDVIGFEKGDEGVVYIRPMYAGNAEARVVIDTPTHVLTVRETAFDHAAPGGPNAQVTEHPVELDPANLKSRFVEFNLSKSERPELTEAKTIVSAGRGVKDADGVQLIEKLADTLGAALGGSRSVVDEGLLPNDLQVGQTGKIVAPDLYFACGISGAIQHVAGMKDSKIIVAINKDEEAPIFEVADYGLVDDLFKAVPKLMEQIEQVKAAKG
jgi:electron transfer flavoprotein alpha subunit